MASTHLSSSTLSSEDQQIFTFSAWVKQSTTGSFRGIINNYSSNTNRASIYFHSNNSLYFYSIEDDSTQTLLATNAKYRDVNAWYHVVVAVDTTQATAADRVKMYVNGEYQDSLAETTYPSQNANMRIVNVTNNLEVGRFQYGTGPTNAYWDGSMAHVHYIDGTQYAASDFGETDSTSGIWKPKVSPSVTYGTNGFFLKFQDSSSLGDDSSGNTNDLTLSGSGKQILDTPSNVFATLNPLHSSETSATNFFTSLGNLELTTTNNDFGRQMGITLNPKSMKGYFEMKVAVSDNFQIHIQDIKRKLRKDAYNVGSSNPTWMFAGENISYGNGSGWTTHISNYLSTSNGDIVGIAFDFTGSNKNIWFHTNGTYGNNGSGVGNPATGAYPAITASNLNKADHYAFIFSVNTGASESSIQLNFGNGYFGTTAVSSAENDDDGYGKFEYDVPAGFYALCTKNINNHG